MKAFREMDWSTDEEEDENDTRWKYRGKYAGKRDPLPGCAQYYDPTPWEKTRVMTFLGRKEVPDEVRNSSVYRNYETYYFVPFFPTFSVG